MQSTFESLSVVNIPVLHRSWYRTCASLIRWQSLRLFSSLCASRWSCLGKLRPGVNLAQDLLVFSGTPTLTSAPSVERREKKRSSPRPLPPNTSANDWPLLSLKPYYLRRTPYRELRKTLGSRRGRRCKCSRLLDGSSNGWMFWLGYNYIPISNEHFWELFRASHWAHTQHPIAGASLCGSC